MKYEEVKDIENPKSKNFIETIPDLLDQFGRVSGKITFWIICATGLKNTALIGKNDPFCEVFLSSNPQTKLKTKTIDNDLNPKWDFQGTFDVNYRRQQVKDI